MRGVQQGINKRPFLPIQNRKTGETDISGMASLADAEQAEFSDMALLADLEQAEEVGASKT